MSSLYELSLEFDELLAQVEADAVNADVDEEEVLQEMLSQLGMEIDNKCDNIISYIKQLTVEKNALAEEVKLLQLRAKRKAKRIESLKNYLVIAGVTKYESTAGVIKPSRSQAVVVDDESALANIYFNEKITRTVNKTRISNAIKQGEEVPGAHIEKRESVVVK